MNTRFKVFASYNILQYLCDFIHVLIFVTVSKCQKSPKLTNIVIATVTVTYSVDFSSKLQLSMTIFHHKLLTREGRVMAQWMNSSIIHDSSCSLIHKKSHPKSYQGDIKYHMTTKGRFTLRWRSPPVKNSRGILKIDWPRVTLFSSGGLHYGQGSFGGELWTWMK